MDVTVAIVAIAGILMPVGILAIIFGFANRSESRFHQTVQKAIDNGQKLDEEVLSGIPGYQKKASPRDDIRNGVITSGTGLGITLLGFVGLGSVITGAGLLVFCIGMSIFAYGYMTKGQNQGQTGNPAAPQTTDQTNTEERQD